MTAARRRASADWDAVKQKYPSTQFGEKQWLAVFDANPDIAFRVIGDICKAVVATEADVRRTGRRPSPNLGMHDVERILSPRYSMDPFPVALEQLMRERGISQRAFASKVPVHHHTLRRYLEGEIHPDKAGLAALARAGRAQPHYFREWRLLELQDLMAVHFEKHPNDSITFIKRIRALSLA